MSLVISLSLVSELCVRQVSGLVFLLSSEESGTRWDICPKISQKGIDGDFFFSSVDTNKPLVKVIKHTYDWCALPSLLV